MDAKLKSIEAACTDDSAREVVVKGSSVHLKVLMLQPAACSCLFGTHPRDSFALAFRAQGSLLKSKRSLFFGEFGEIELAFQASRKSFSDIWNNLDPITPPFNPNLVELRKRKADRSPDNDTIQTCTVF